MCFTGRSYIFMFIQILLIGTGQVLFSQETDDPADTLLYSVQVTEYSRQSSLNFLLLQSAAEGNIAGMRWLLKEGAEVNCKNSVKVTPLHFAVANNHVRSVELLLINGADVNSFSGYSENPLLLAVKNNNGTIAEILIRDSADVNASDRFGATPLHYASAFGYLTLADLLLYYEAATYKKDKDGTTPLMAAVWVGNADIADLLLQNGANPEDRDLQGFTPLLIAAQNGDTLLMDMLLKRFVNLYETNNYGYNALTICIRYNHKEAVDFLLRRGKDWDSEDKNISPLTIATIYNRKDIITRLEDEKIKGSYKYHFELASITTSIRYSIHDYYLGFRLSAREPKLNGGPYLGFDLKPGYTRVMIKESSDSYTQYLDKSYLVYAGLFKEFSLTDMPSKGNWAFGFNLAAAYSFANKLKGTEIVPGNKVMILPGIGLKWYNNQLTISGDLEYQSTDFYKIGPIWLRLGASYNIKLNYLRTPGKTIRWY